MGLYCIGKGGFHVGKRSAPLTQPCYSQIHGYYRATGASISKAQAEFTTNVFSNEAVRNAAANAAVAGVRQGFQVSGGGGGGSWFYYLLFAGTTRSAGPEILSNG